MSVFIASKPVRPPLHHADALVPKLRPRIGAANRVPSTWASASIASEFQRPHSFSIDDAVARKPCDVISSLEKPIRRNATFSVFSESGRARAQALVKTRGPSHVISRMRFKTSIVCRASGMRCGRPIFIRPAGILQIAALRSISAQAAPRNSPGRTKVRASNCKPHSHLRRARIVVDCPEQLESQWVR